MVEGTLDSDGLPGATLPAPFVLAVGVPDIQIYDLWCTRNATFRVRKIRPLGDALILH
jgi:hypothetical protein